MPSYLVFCGNLSMPKPCFILGTIRVAISSGLSLKVCIPTTSNDSIKVITFIANLKQNEMDLFTYIGQLSFHNVISMKAI